ncbi:MAG: hypothetical protein U0837_02245 [Dehalococcoidia bacterium]
MTAKELLRERIEALTEEEAAEALERWLGRGRTPASPQVSKRSARTDAG